MAKTWDRTPLYDDPFTSPSHPPKDNTFRWATRVARPSASSRFSSFRLSPVRVSVLLVTVAFVVFVRDHLPVNVYRGWRQKATCSSSNSSLTALIPLDSTVDTASRANEMTDAFASYKYRDTCNISSLDLHVPFSPLCPDRASMLKAMSSGGRIGNDAPYTPRYCDMRWFTTEEICEILGRFERIVLIGDSMLRHVIGSMNILIRKDLGYGAVTDWNFSAQEKKQCFCNEQFDVKACSVQGIYKTADVLAHDPKSVACSNNINLMMEQINRHPIPPEELTRLKTSIGTPTKTRKAFILGHGLWNNLDLQQTVNWMDVILDAIGPDWHGLFVTPNAAGKEKPDDWIVTQGNKALMLFEEGVKIEAEKRGLEHLGTWNMSVQCNKFDGVHLDLRGNLVKAMMVLNWLSLVE